MLFTTIGFATTKNAQTKRFPKCHHGSINLLFIDAEPYLMRLEAIVFLVIIKNLMMNVHA